MRIIVLSALATFLACCAIWLIGHAVDQVRRDAQCISPVAACAAP